MELIEDEVAKKSEAIKALTETYAKLCDLERLDAVLAVFRGGDAAEAEKEKKSGAKRGPYKVTGIRLALDDGSVVAPDSLVAKVEPHQYVPGKTPEEKLEWLKRQMRKSPSVYREWPDGAWSLRKSNAPANNGK